MTLLGHDRYCDEIIRQTAELTRIMSGADLSARVPSCPDWSLGDLARHVGGAHRWVETLVRTRSRDDIAEELVPDAAGPADSEPAALTAWLADGARVTADTLRASGEDTPVWTWGWEPTAGFWARRMTHETVIHRADAALAVGAPYEVAPEVAVDAVDEWLQVVSFAASTGDRAARELRGAGRSIHLHATDAPEELRAEWLVEFDEEGFTWRHGHEKASVALRGPLGDVLRVVYRRLPADSDRVQVLGEAQLLDFWLARASFA